MTDALETPAIQTSSGTIRVAPLLALPKLLENFRIPWKPLFEQHGLSSTLLDNPENTLPLAVVGPLLKTCVAVTGCDHFGLLLGQMNNASTLGATGFLLRNAPDVDTALQELILNFDLHDRGATPFIKKMPVTSILGYEIYSSGIEGAEQITECAIAVAQNLMKNLCGTHWRPLAVQFRHSEFGHIEAHRRFFQAPVNFNAENNALVFRTSCLSEKVADADALLRHHFQQHVAHLRSLSRQDFKSLAKLAIAQLIAKEQCTQETLASHLSMHPRTLNRRLKETGTSFRELLGQARHAKVCELLSDTEHSIKSISAILGYSSPAALGRAFASWEGVPPSTWRSATKFAQTNSNSEK